MCRSYSQPTSIVHAPCLRLILATISLAFGVPAITLAADDLEARQWQVDGVQRDALVYLPTLARSETSSATRTPLVFVFHGHGGTMRHAARTFHLHELWPEAICVYPQGLNTAGRLTDPEGKKPGWQPAVGENNDRDLKFFDSMLESLKKQYAVDETRVFSTGHSNGAGFTYLLWSERGDQLAAVAPSAAVAKLNLASKLKPKPVLHLAGEKDALVKFAWQERTIAQLKKLNQCASDSKEWELQSQLFSSPIHTPVVTYIHSGTHAFPREAPELIVRFFKSYAELTKATKSPASN